MTINRRSRRIFLKTTGLAVAATTLAPAADLLPPLPPLPGDPPTNRVFPPSPPDSQFPYRFAPGPTFDPKMKNARGVAIDRKDNLYVAGAPGVKVFSSKGELLRTLKTSSEARCVVVDQEGYVYIGLKTKIEKFTPKGARETAWGEEGRGNGQLLHVTSLAVVDNVLYVADAGNRRLYRFAVNGDFVDAREGFNVPSPYFDCAVDKLGNIHVVNPAEHRIERYDANDKLLGSWGKFGTAPDRFSGCCNPTNFALFPDGRVVTTEKGIPRLKLSSPTGELLAHLGPEAFPRTIAGMDLALDSTGRIRLVDSKNSLIRSYRLVATR